MKLVNFSVKNFRSITSAHKVPISESTTILIGKNNEGKSNILKGLDIAMAILKEHAEGTRIRRPIPRRLISREEMRYLWERDFPISLQDKNSTRTTLFRLEFSLEGSEIEEFWKDIKSHLNGTLPIEIKIGKENEATIKVSKKGKGSKVLNSKSGEIAEFIANKISFNYIPAIRTDQEALYVVRRMLAQRLIVLEEEEGFKSALNLISNLQQPVLNALSESIKESLSEFIPNIKSVEIEIQDAVRRSSLRSDLDIIIDDGTPTSLEFKGDGVKSLAAISLLKNRISTEGASVIAIEEPESHLHPAALHQLNEVISSLSKQNQVIISTHNPVFVDRQDIKSNIIIDSGTAIPARNINQIRQLLGIKASDNLVNAEYVLVVEGEDDKISVGALLKNLSSKLAKHLRDQILIIDFIGGAGNLSYKLTLLNSSLCVYHVLLDNDKAGRNAYDKAKEDGVISSKNCTMINCDGMNNSELEDCLDPQVYKQDILDKFGVDINSPKFKGNARWSDRMRSVFKNQGKQWDDRIKSDLKHLVADCVKKNPSVALSEHKKHSLEALVTSLEVLINR